MTYYVNSKVEIHGDGTKEKPFKTIQEAANIAVAGDEVIVAPGVYREWVNPINGGQEGKRIVYKSEVPLGAHITGAEDERLNEDVLPVSFLGSVVSAHG